MYRMALFQNIIKRDDHAGGMPGALPHRAEEASEASLAQFDIHTIPERFFTLKKSSSAHWAKRKIVQGAIIIAIVGGLMGIGAWLFLRSIVPQEEGVLTAAPEENPPRSPAEQAPPPMVELPQEVTPSAPDESSAPIQGENSLAPTSSPMVEIEEEVIEGNEGTPRGAAWRKLPLSLDTDGDTLTDVEEALWGTDPARPDSDADGYLDGKELLSLFDPTQGGAAKLEQSPRVRIYLNSQFSYALLIPLAWEERMLDPGSAAQVLFAASTGEFVNVIAQENVEGFTSPRDWYLSLNGAADPVSLQDVETALLKGVQSPDGLVAYFIERGYLFTISYNPGIRDAVNFQTTFQTMVQSFRTFVAP